MDNSMVSKYGGSSVTSEDDLRRIARITCDDERRKVVVVSAPGRRSYGDAKVTDLLISLDESNEVSLVERVMERYGALGAPSRLVDDLRAELLTRVQQPPSEKRTDLIKAFGEYASANVVAEQLGARFVDAADVIKVTSDFGNAKILPESEELVRRLSLDEVVVLPGFYGATAGGDIATFSRGGSDLTGAYVAAALGASVYENFTDSAIKAAYPFVKNPRTIAEVTTAEIRDLSYLGFNILHPETMYPVAMKSIPVHVRGFREYPAEGTHIVADRLSNGRTLVGVAYQGGFCAVNVSRFGLNEERGVYRRILQAFEEEGLSVEFAPSAIDDVTVVLRNEGLDGQRISGLFRRIKREVGEQATVRMERESLACLVAAGKGIRSDPGIAAEIQLDLLANDIPVYFMEMGSQRRCVIYGIHEQDGDQAVNLVYDRFVK